MKNRLLYLITLILLIFLMLPLSLLAQEESFEIVVLPDTQTYVEEYPEIYLKQMQWLADNRDRFSFVMHVGDITQNNNQEEWEIAKKGFELLDGILPYAFALGNHDMGSEAGKFADTRNTAMANKFFSPDEMQNLVASFPQGTVDNLLQEFTAEGQKWMVLSLEFGPRNKTLDWANEMIAKFPDHNFIMVTHAHVYEDNTHHDGEDWWLPENYGIGKDTGAESPNNGGEVWEEMLKKHPNVKLVFSGHILKSGVGTLVSEGINGNKVYQMLANYQKGVEGSENGGNGFLRILEIYPGKGKIEVKTYSPVLDEYKEEEEQQFSFENVEFQ
ncbi:metallophosphoesterase [Salegentibacter sp. HM20]